MNLFNVDLGANRFQINDVWFNLDISEAMRTKTSTEHEFLLAKTPEMLMNLQLQLAGRTIRNIFDIGIFKGGSVAFYAELFRPEKLVAIEYSEERVTALDDYIASHGLAESVRAYYGTDQADAPTLKRIYEKEFGSQRLDLVVDDASHLYEQTKASFNALFPKVAPGGLYVIEDWGWSHWPGDQWQAETSYFVGKRPVSCLLFEIIMACASSMESAIKGVRTTGSVIYVERGWGELPESWDVSSAFLSQGKPWWENVRI